MATKSSGLELDKTGFECCLCHLKPMCPEANDVWPVVSSLVKWRKTQLLNGVVEMNKWHNKEFRPVPNIQQVNSSLVMSFNVSLLKSFFMSFGNV